MRKQHELFCCKLCLKHLKVCPEDEGAALGNPQKLPGLYRALGCLQMGKKGPPVAARILQPSVGSRAELILSGSSHCP